MFGKWGIPLIFPFSSPLNVCVGRPIDVPEMVRKMEGEMGGDEVEKGKKMTDVVHKKFIEEIERLFEENKEKYGYHKNKKIQLA